MLSEFVPNKIRYIYIYIYIYIYVVTDIPCFLAMNHVRVVLLNCTCYLIALPKFSLQQSLWNWPQVNATRPHRWLHVAIIGFLMGWCRWATGHYLNQCWPWSQMPYDVIRPQWVKTFLDLRTRLCLFLSFCQSICPICIPYTQTSPYNNQNTCLLHLLSIT